MDELLTSAPMGFAKYLPQVGWLVYEQVKRKLRLFRIDELSGEQAFVVEPNADIASAIWTISLTVDPDEQRPFKINEVVEPGDDERNRGLDDLLTLGPVGHVTWSDERGWLAV